ncbi:MAG: hypothetical protein SCALA702_05240 [Melioribacteraceae bacterium]|nr:MAG: hypothetical protein SCALA702_05240 [Melioribacteraceae bacterium]
MLKTRIIFVIISVVFSFQTLFAVNLDSLKNLIPTTTGEELVDLYNEIASNISGQNREKLNFAESAEELAATLRYNKGKADALKNIGSYHILNEDNDKALEYYFRAKQFYSSNDYENLSKINERIAVAYYENKDNNNAKLYYKKSIELLNKFPVNSFHASPNNNLGLLYWRMSYYDSALTYYNSALEVAHALNDSSYLGRLLNNIGVIYWQWTLYDKAIENYLKSLDIRYALKDSIGVGRLLNNIGLTYLQIDDNEKAMNYFNQALELSREIPSDELTGYSYYNMGAIYIRNNEYTKALEIYKSSRKHYKLDNIYSGDLLTSIQIGEIFNLLGKPDSAMVYLENGLRIGKETNNQKRISMALMEMGKSYSLVQNYNKAISAFDEALDISSRIGKDDLSTDIFYERAKLLEKLGEYKNSLQDYKSYYELKDSVKNIEVQRKIVEYQSKFETQQANIALKDKEFELERNRIFLISAFAAIVILVVLLIILYRINYLKNKTNKQLSDTNVTVRKQNEEINSQKARLEDAFIKLNNHKNELDINISTKDKLFSVLAHDIKNPLGVILNYSELLKQKDTLSESEIDEIIESIARSAQKLSELLNTILTWSKSQQGLININKEKIEIRSEIEFAAQPLKTWLDQKGIIFNNVDTPVSIYTDKFMFHTVIRNLIHNSIKYTKSGGKIYIEAFEDEFYSIINVSDTGEGISKEKLSRIFSGIKDEKNSQSTGLGLKICKDFIEKQNGIINVISEIGNGTTFSIKLPKN